MLGKTILIASFLAVNPAAIAGAYSYTGNELLSDYKAKEALTQLQAVRYVQGYLASEDARKTMEPMFATLDKREWHPERFLCMPGRATLGQVVDVVVAFLEQTPERRHEDASTLISFALRSKWKCDARTDLLKVSE